MNADELIREGASDRGMGFKTGVANQLKKMVELGMLIDSNRAAVMTAVTYMLHDVSWDSGDPLKAYLETLVEKLSL